MAGLGVPDDAGVHGGLRSPAPLQVAHGVLVQMASQHGGDAGSYATRRELQAALRRHEASATAR